MSTERFSKNEFELALPQDKHTFLPLWSHRGLINGEYEYKLDVADNVKILVRSSVGSDGYAKSTGEDSIRCWLVDDKGKPLGGKIQTYVTRVKGWQDRLTEQLRKLWRIGWMLADPCEKCKVQPAVYKVKKAGLNKGRLFIKCACAGSFEWIEVDGKPNAK